MVEAALELGIVCGGCDGYCPMGMSACPRCDRPLALSGSLSASLSGAQKLSVPPAEPLQDPEEVTIAYDPDAGKRPVTAAPVEIARSQAPQIDRVSRGTVPAEGRAPSPPPGLTEEELMDQARNYVCESCMTPVPSGHKFCGRCGTPVPEYILHLQTKFFSDLQDPAKARLVLIRAQDMEGVSFHLNAEQHIIGRDGDLDGFSDDAFISPKHANFLYRSDKLVVRDEGSLNGVYIRIRGSVEISPGDSFIAGEQLFRVDPTPKASDGADPEGTMFYSSPKYPSAFRVHQVLEAGALGMTVCARESVLRIGREDGDLNFPGDVYMSAKHCSVEENDGKFTLTDHDSRNGTYVRIKADRELNQGDYLFLGKKLLRVELTN